jgi:dipeptidyl aminopeptidase/acylaminoacyl peptidase
MCRQHPFVDESRVGCIGASYGGFMTQYLVSMTDIFACAVSHAGISNHTSYWGNGYWGYSYSEVSMAEKYPWNAKDLYTDQSPLFRADKINTPLLLTHGTADTNVPPMESMQLFTALKLLDRDVAFVQFKDENHWIENYERRRLWTSTIMAWFEKYLKGDDTWWYTLYPKRHL